MRAGSHLSDFFYRQNLVKNVPAGSPDDLLVFFFFFGIFRIGYFANQDRRYAFSIASSRFVFKRNIYGFAALGKLHHAGQAEIFVQRSTHQTINSKILFILRLEPQTFADIIANIFKPLMPRIYTRLFVLQILGYGISFFKQSRFVFFRKVPRTTSSRRVAKLVFVI